jgi:hypothetical protein
MVFEYHDLLLLGICFLRGVPEDVVGEIGKRGKEGRKGGAGVREWNKQKMTSEQLFGKGKS